MPLSRRGGDVSRASNLSEGGGSDKPAINPLESPSLGGHGPSDASTGFMQLVPNNMPKPHLISSIDPDETVSGADSRGSVSLSKRTATPSKQSSLALHWDLRGRRGAVHLCPYFRSARR